MVKHVKVWDLSAKLDHHQSIYVRNFPGGKNRSMKDYTKSCTREENPDHIIFHVSTNGLISDNGPEPVGNTTVNLAKKFFRKEQPQSPVLYQEMINGTTRQN